MSLLGIDVGTTGCKSIVLSVDGTLLAMAQREYDVARPQPGWAELDSAAVWRQIQDMIREVATKSAADPITALSVSSMGEALTPVSRDRAILGNCLLGFDCRGAATTERLAKLDPVMFFERSGNLASPAYGGQKVLWLRDNRPDLFDRTYKFLSWADLVGYMLGGEPCTDFSLANRTLFFDVPRASWSRATLDYLGMPVEKLPDVAQAGTVVGTVSRQAADDLGLPPGVRIVLGAHDQCMSATGAGVMEPGQAAYGLGTYICITPAYDTIPPTAGMIGPQLNVEHHTIPGLYVSFYYNLTGGTVLKWFRDTFAQLEKREAQAAGRDVYDALLAEMPPEPTDLMVLPHFAPTGPPYFDQRPYGLIAGVTLETSRGAFLKGLLEGVTYYFRHGLDLLSAAGIAITEFRATGGGARSDAWLQLTADVLGRPLTRPHVTEASAMGASILAGTGSGVYSSTAQAVRALVKTGRAFEPHPGRHRAYEASYAQYELLYPFCQSLHVGGR
jgi:xylulokinase